MAKAVKAPLYLVGTDGSPPARQAVDFAANMAKRDGARLCIVLVHRFVGWAATPSGIWMGPPVAAYEAAVKAGEDALAEAKARARRLGVDAQTEIFPPQDPAVALVQCAQSEKASLLVVGSHGRTGIRRALLGSVAERVVRLAHCPVVVVR